MVLPGNSAFWLVIRTIAWFHTVRGWGESLILQQSGIKLGSKVDIIATSNLPKFRINWMNCEGFILNWNYKEMYGKTWKLHKIRTIWPDAIHFFGILAFSNSCKSFIIYPINFKLRIITFCHNVFISTKFWVHLS